MKTRPASGSKVKMPASERLRLKVAGIAKCARRELEQEPTPPYGFGSPVRCVVRETELPAAIWNMMSLESPIELQT
jgi:hypothetical protein